MASVWGRVACWPVPRTAPPLRSAAPTCCWTPWPAGDSAASCLISVSAVLASICGPMPAGSGGCWASSPQAVSRHALLCASACSSRGAYGSGGRLKLAGRLNWLPLVPSACSPFSARSRGGSRWSCPVSRVQRCWWAGASGNSAAGSCRSPPSSSRSPRWANSCRCRVSWAARPMGCFPCAWSRAWPAARGRWGSQRCAGSSAGWANPCWRSGCRSAARPSSSAWRRVAGNSVPGPGRFPAGSTPTVPSPCACWPGRRSPRPSVQPRSRLPCRAAGAPAGCSRPSCRPGAGSRV